MKTKLLGKWVSAEKAKKWPEGIIVISHCTDRPLTYFRTIELHEWFRPDWIERFGNEKTKYMKLTDKPNR